MAEGLALAQANAVLNALLAAYPWLKLHTGAPGAAGTANAALETTRKDIVPTTSTLGTANNSAALVWTNVANVETYTHYSCWSAATAGTFGHSGTLSGGAVAVGNTVNVAIGGVVFTLPSAA